MKFSETKKGKKLWKENWDRKDLIAGDISGFTQWFMDKSYEQGKKDAKEKKRYCPGWTRIANWNGGE